MKLLAPADVSLRLNAPWSHHALPRSEIFVEGRASGQVVAGEVLKGAVRWKDCWVLLVTDNIPFEDCLHVYLFDAQWKLVDSATLGPLCANETFSGLTLVRPNFLCFQFTGRATWTLELLERGVLALPFFDPRGVSRPFSLFRRFRLHGFLLPESGSMAF